MVLRGLGIGRKRGGGASTPIDPPAGIDTTPNAFELGAPVQGEPDAILYSEEFTVLGVTAAVAIPATLTGGRGDCRIERWNGSTWDNLGSTADLYLNDLCRLRTRAHTGADTFVLTLTIGGVTDTLTVNTVVGLTAPAAPTATQLSAAGTNPMTISVNFGNNNLIPPDENDVAYDYIEHRHRVNGGAWVNETAKPVNMAFIGDHLVDGNPISWPLYNAATFTAGQVVGRMVGITRAPFATVWSNEVSDTMGAAVVEPWEPNLSPPAAVDHGYSSTSYTFPGVTFTPGLAIVMVSMTDRECSGVTVNGNPASLVAQSSASRGASIWQIVLGAGGNFDVQVSAAIAFGRVAISTGTLTGMNTAATDTAVLPYGFYGAGANTPNSSLIVPAGGVGLIAHYSESNNATTWTGATEETDFGIAAGIRHSSASLTATATPVVNGHDNAGTAIAGAAWGPL